MFNCIDIYIVIPVSGCVGMGLVHCFAQGPMMLLGRPCIYICFFIYKRNHNFEEDLAMITIIHYIVQFGFNQLEIF